MAIVKMNKFTLLAFESEKEKLLKKIQSSSEVEFINLQDEENFIIFRCIGGSDARFLFK